MKCTHPKKNGPCGRAAVRDDLCEYHHPELKADAWAQVRREQRSRVETPESQPRPKCPERFADYLELVTPEFNWRWPHLALIQEKLDAVTRGEIKRLMLFLPPRHGKTESATVRYSAYRVERDPATRVIVGAFNQQFASKLSRKVRKIARKRVPLSAERAAVDDWETEEGGGLRAVGVGGGITGHGGDLIIIDEAIKSREWADSATWRDFIWTWYTEDLHTRLEPNGAIVIINTRWRDDDLCGRILASPDGPNWTVVSLPAEAEENDPLGRGRVPCPICAKVPQPIDVAPIEKEPPTPCYNCEGLGTVGAPLCPDRFDEKAFAEKKIVLGRSWWALYQQRPRKRDGEMFQRDWFEIVQAAPAEGECVRWWDQGATANSGDPTVGVRLRMHRSIVYVENVVHGRWAPTQRDRIIRQTAELDGYACAQWTEQEPGASGKTAAEAFVRLLVGFTAHYKPSSGSKELRAEPFASYAGAGNVKLVAGPWNAAFLDELCDFPTGTHDDQVDASASAFNVLASATETVFELAIGSLGGLEQEPVTI